MALTDYKVAFDNSYQEIFQKTLVAKDIMNMRLEPMLTYGGSVTRVAMDLSNVLVRSVVRGSASTIDSITDTTEVLTIDLEKEVVFHISDGEVTQTGPLKAMQFAGKELARKLAIDLDARCFSEVRNALFSFDAGDLTTGVSSGTAITLDATTVPQMVSRMSAKLRNKNNQEIMTNMALVVDSYAASDITQYLLGKNIDMAGSVFKNGYTGDVNNAQLYISENLTGEVNLVVDVATADESITINGVTFTAKATPSVAGEFDIAGAVDAQGAIMANMINGTGTQNDATSYFEISAANREILTNAQVRATYTAATDTLNILAAGRIVYSDTLSGAVTNHLNCYFGKKGAIDLVIQDMQEVDIRKTDDRRGNNVFSSYLAGVKTFADGAKKFLNVKILVA